MSHPAPTHEDIEEKGHFIIEAIGSSVAGRIYLPGFPKFEGNPKTGEQPHPGIQIIWSDPGRRVFDVIAASKDYGNTMLALYKGNKTPKKRQEFEKQFVDEILNFLGTWDEWANGTVIWWRSTEEINAERDAEAAASISDDTLISELRRRGDIPEDGEISEEDALKIARKLLTNNKGDAGTQAQA